MQKNELSFKKCFIVFSFNFIFFAFLMIINMGIENPYVFNIILIVFYLVILLFKDELFIITSQISFMIICYVFLDLLWIKTRLQAPLELKYIVDLICVVLIIKIISKSNYYKTVLKDKFFITIMLIEMLSLSVVIINNGSIYFNTSMQ